MNPERVYMIILEPIPQSICALPSNVNFKPVKDELRRAIQQARNEALYTEPRVIVGNGLAYFDVKDYEDALATHEIMQGHFWSSQGYTLNCYLSRRDGGEMKQLLGPFDDATGSMLEFPVPISPPIAPTMYRRRRPTLPSGPPPAGAQSGNTGSNYYDSRGHNVYASSAGMPVSADPISASSEDPAGNIPRHYAGFTYARPQQYVHGSPNLAMTPALYSSSRNSSVSTLSTMTVPLDIANLSITPNGSRNLSLSNSSVTSATARGHDQNRNPPSSIQEFDSKPSSPAAVHGYKITIRNLSQDATEERVYKLIEDNTHAFVKLIQPDSIVLRRVHGQLHAYVKFIRKEDAEKAVKHIHGLHFMERVLRATLG